MIEDNGSSKAVSDMTREELEDEVSRLRELNKKENDHTSDNDFASSILKEQEDVFTALFYGVPEGMLVAGKESMKFKYANNTMCELLGYTEDEFKELNVLDIHPQKDIPYVLEQFNSPEAQGKYFNVESIPLLTKDGVTIYCDVKGTNMIIEGEESNVGFFTNVTERVEAKKEFKNREMRVTRHHAAIVRMLKDPEVFDVSSIEPLKKITEMAARTLDVARASIWFFNEDKSLLEIADLYEANEDRHSSGVSVKSSDYPRYFEAIESQRAVSAVNAQTDPRTNEFADYYLKPLGIASMLDAGIRCRGKMEGVVCIEHIGEPREWFSDEVTFAAEIADLVSQYIITRERISVSKELGDREARLESIFRATPTGIGVVANRTVLDLNERVCEMTGYSREELLNQNARIFYPSQEEYDWVGVEKYRQIDIYGTGTVETKWQRKDGRIIDVLLSSTPIRQDDLEAGVTFSVLDISERKQIERNLRDSELKFRAITENTSDLTVIIDKDQQSFSYVSPSVRRITGYEPTEVVGLGPANFLHPDDIDDSLELIETSLSQPGQHYTQRGLRAVHKTGRTLYLDCVMVSMPDVPVINGTVINCRDITERQYAEEELDRYRRSLEDLVQERTAELRRTQKQLISSERLAVLGKFAGSIAHEIRNPLAVIANAAFFLRNRIDSDDEKVQDYLVKVERQVERTAEIIDSIMKLTRMQSPERKAVDLVALARNCIYSLQSPDYITININTQEKVVNIMADFDQMQIALKNILKNAIQAIENSGTIDIDISPGKNGFAKIAISDNGSGIPQENLEQIFDPLFTTKSFGIGFGLSIVKMIVEHHGGSISATSIPGEKTVFTIKLPVS